MKLKLRRRRSSVDGRHAGLDASMHNLGAATLAAVIIDTAAARSRRLLGLGEREREEPDLAGVVAVVQRHPE